MTDQWYKDTLEEVQAIMSILPNGDPAKDRLYQLALNILNRDHAAFTAQCNTALKEFAASNVTTEPSPTAWHFDFGSVSTGGSNELLWNGNVDYIFNAPTPPPLPLFTFTVYEAGVDGIEGSVRRTVYPTRIDAKKALRHIDATFPCFARYCFAINEQTGLGYEVEYEHRWETDDDLSMVNEGEEVTTEAKGDAERVDIGDIVYIKTPDRILRTIVTAIDLTTNDVTSLVEWSDPHETTP